MAKLVDLKAEADMLGIEYDEKIKFKALEKKIKDFKEETMPKIEEEEEDGVVENPPEDKKEEEKLTIEKAKAIIKKDTELRAMDLSLLKAGADTAGIKIHPTKADLEENVSSEGLTPVQKATRIYKVMITNMNPETQNQQFLHQDIWSAAHGLLSSRVVPYNTAWHVEKCLLDYVMEEEYPHRKEVTVKNDSGANETHIVTEMRKKYGIQLLPHNTPEEMKKLADDQRKTDRLKED